MKWKTKAEIEAEREKQEQERKEREELKAKINESPKRIDEQDDLIMDILLGRL